MDRAAVVAEALSWLGTPYHSHGRLKGIGVDCAMLLAEVYERAGVVKHIDPGFYPPQFGWHRSDEVFRSFVEQHGTQVENPEAGDCVLFRFGRCYSHGGVMVTSERLVHASMPDTMVILSDLCEAPIADREAVFFTVHD